MFDCFLEFLKIARPSVALKERFGLIVDLDFVFPEISQNRFGNQGNVFRAFFQARDIDRVRGNPVVERVVERVFLDESFEILAGRKNEARLRFVCLYRFGYFALKFFG
mgnify:CR=1 FL=1